MENVENFMQAIRILSVTAEEFILNLNWLLEVLKYEIE